MAGKSVYTQKKIFLETANLWSHVDVENLNKFLKVDSFQKHDII